MKIIPLAKIHYLKLQLHIYSLILSLLVLLGGLSACHNKTPDDSQSPCNQNPGNCKSVLEAKDFFLFKVGSYWVYEEESSHQRDSIYVTQYNTTTSYDFDVRMMSSLTEYEYHYWPAYYQNIDGCSPTGLVTKKCIYINRSKFKFQDFLGESHVFFVNYKVGDFSTTGGNMNYCQDNKITVGSIFENYTIPFGTFQNVVRIDEDCDVTEGRQPTRFYYSKNNFIIRKELIDSNQVWNLVNYNVIQ